MQDLFDFDALWDYNEPKKTEAKFRVVLKRIPKSNFVYLELLTQIARAQGLQGEFDKAHRMLNKVVTNLKGDYSRAHIRYLLERGRVFNSALQPDQADPFFEEALEMATRLHEDFYAIDAMHMLAITAIPAESMRLNLQAVAVAENSSQEKARNWLGSLYNNIGWTYHDDMGDFESALEMFEKAEAFRIEHGTEERRRVATWSIARTLRSMNKVEEALAKQLQLEKEFESAKETDGYVFEEIAECLLVLNRAEEARPYFAKAHQVLSKDMFLVEQEPERIARLKELGSIENRE